MRKTIGRLSLASTYIPLGLSILLMATLFFCPQEIVNAFIRTYVVFFCSFYAVDMIITAWFGLMLLRVSLRANAHGHEKWSRTFRIGMYWYAVCALFAWDMSLVFLGLALIA